MPVDFTIAMALAAWFCGRAVAFVDPLLTPSQQNSVLTTLQPAMWVTLVSPVIEMPAHILLLDFETDIDGQAFDHWLSHSELASLPEPYCWAADDVAIVLFTSGTTGQPKGVCHSLQNLLHSGFLFHQQFDLGASDRLINLAPLHTMSGLRCSIFLPLLIGCNTHLEAIPGQLSALLQAISDEQGTVLIIGPVMLEQLALIAERLPELKRLRQILSTGAELSRSVRTTLWQKLGIPVLDYYGLTETCGLVIAEPSENYQPEQSALGLACREVKAVVVDESGSETTVGCGELRIYCSALFLGYWGQEQVEPSFFDTRDKVDISEQGWISFLGRQGRSVKSAATTWLHPEAVEGWLVARNGINDFAVTTVVGQLRCGN